MAVTFEITPNTEARVTAQPGRLIVQFEADALELSIPLVPPQTFLTGITPGDTPSTVVLTPRAALPPCIASPRRRPMRVRGA